MKEEDFFSHQNGASEGVKWCSGERSEESPSEMLKRIKINIIMQIMRKHFWRNFSLQNFVKDALQDCIHTCKVYQSGEETLHFSYISDN